MQRKRNESGGWNGLETPTTTKVPVPIVVVLENILCRDLSLATFADRVDHDVQQQQHNGYDHDEHGKLALAPVATGQRFLLVDVLLAVLGAHAMHQQAMVVHAVGRAGDERHLVGAVVLGLALNVVALVVIRRIMRVEL